MQSIKQWIKWIVPTPLRVFEWGMENILSGIKKLQKRIRDLSARVEGLQSTSNGIANELQAGRKRHEAVMEEWRAERERAETHKKQLEDLLDGLRSECEQVQNAQIQIRDQQKISQEILWGQIFTHAITNSVWLKDQSFSPGRWALGYPALYILFRILNDVRPRRILELGLGESTKMIRQYAASREDGEHVVVEHDPQWISFSKEGLGGLSDRSKIVELSLERRADLEGNKIAAYAKFAEKFNGRKFDLIVIDGPFGGETNLYSRLDILDILPEGLADSFIILLDDYNRQGEQNTASLIRKKLKENQVVFCDGKYSGQKDIWIICSEDLGFLRSL